MYLLSFEAISPYLAKLPDAMFATLTLSVSAGVLSALFGIIGALARRSRWPALRFVIAAYVELMRNIPLLVILYVVYFTLPQTGLRVSGYYSALVALTLNGTAYMVEIFRSGLAAVPRGQFEATQAQGMTGFQAFRLVIFPQIIRTIYSPLGNLFIAIVTGSSLASVVSVTELTGWMGNSGALSFRYFEVFIVAAMAYLLICQLINVIRILISRFVFHEMKAVR